MLERHHKNKQWRSEMPTVTLTQHVCKYKVHKLHQRDILHLYPLIIHPEDVSLVEFMYLVFTHVPGASYCRWLRSLLYLCDIFQNTNELLCVLILQERSGPHILFQIYKQQLEKLGKKHPMPSSSVYLSHWLCTRLQCTEFLACWWKVSSRCWICWMGLVFEIAQNSGAV